jgi:hypothetical protein
MATSLESNRNSGPLLPLPAHFEPCATDCGRAGCDGSNGRQIPGAAERRGVAALARGLRVRMAGANGADHCAFIEATVTVLINSGAITSSSRNVSVPDSAR